MGLWLGLWGGPPGSCEQIQINPNLSRKGAKNAKKTKDVFLAGLAAWSRDWLSFTASLGGPLAGSGSPKKLDSWLVFQGDGNGVPTGDASHSDTRSANRSSSRGGSTEAIHGSLPSHRSYTQSERG